MRAIVVTGAGRAFCAGMDLSASGNVFGLDESVRPTPAELRDHLTEAPYHDGVRDTGGRVTLAIHACPKPVIAAINGPAVGIGATMTLAMDLRLASTKARIGFVFGRLGIVPEACSTWFLPRIVGVQQALEWIYSADILTADEALAGRLVRSVHEPDDLLPAAHDLARSFVVGRSPVALALAQAAGLPQQRGAGAARGAPVGLAGDVLHLDRRRQGGRGRLPREAGPAVHRPGVRAARHLLTSLWIPAGHHSVPPISFDRPTNVATTVSPTVTVTSYTPSRPSRSRSSRWRRVRRRAGSAPGT